MKPNQFSFGLMALFALAMAFFAFKPSDQSQTEKAVIIQNGKVTFDAFYEPPILVEVLTSSSNSLTVDTIAASETVYFPISAVLSGRYVGSFTVHSDSLSGNPAATVTLQRQNCWNCDDWVDVGTAVTIDGTSTDGKWDLSEAYGVDYRLKYATTGTTQSNRVEADVVFKRLPQ